MAFGFKYCLQLWLKKWALYWNTWQFRVFLAWIWNQLFLEEFIRVRNLTTNVTTQNFIEDGLVSSFYVTFLFYKTKHNYNKYEIWVFLTLKCVIINIPLYFHSRYLLPNAHKPIDMSIYKKCKMWIGHILKVFVCVTVYRTVVGRVDLTPIFYLTC